MADEAVSSTMFIWALAFGGAAIVLPWFGLFVHRWLGVLVSLVLITATIIAFTISHSNMPARINIRVDIPMIMAVLLVDGIVFIVLLIYALRSKQ